MKILFIILGFIFVIISAFIRKMKSIYQTDKYYKKMNKIGKCVRFNGVSTIVGLDKISLGNNVHIGNNAHIKASGGLYIGDNTHISRNLVLYTVNHNYHGELLPYDNTEIEKKVIIEKNVWIGMNVIILPGTHIEEGCIIGAGAVVSGKVKKYSIFGATLGKVLNKRNIEHYKKLNNNNKFGGIDGITLHKSCF